MIADKQIKEVQATVAKLEGQILSGNLTYEQYKERCAERKAYAEAIQIMREISTEDEEDS